MADLDRYASRPSPWAEDPSSESRHAHLHVPLREAIARALTDKQRRVVRAFFYDGLTQGQIATNLGVSQQVVQKTLYGAHRRGKRVGGALAKLRTYLKEVSPETP